MAWEIERSYDLQIRIYSISELDNEKKRKSECSKEKVNRACENGKDDNNHKIYVSMARMSRYDKHSSEIYGDSSQFTNWILDLGATCHMIPEVSYFIPGSLEDTDKYIEVADGYHVTAKQKGQVRIKMLHNVLLAPYLCDRLFSIIT